MMLIPPAPISVWPSSRSLFAGDTQQVEAAAGDPEIAAEDRDPLRSDLLATGNRRHPAVRRRRGIDPVERVLAMVEHPETRSVERKTRGADPDARDRQVRPGRRG